MEEAAGEADPDESAMPLPDDTGGSRSIIIIRRSQKSTMKQQS